MPSLGILPVHYDDIRSRTCPHPASPKYDEVKVTCGFKVSIDVFGGGAEGGGG